jgi:hypothetical protein
MSPGEVGIEDTEAYDSREDLEIPMDPFFFQIGR